MNLSTILMCWNLPRISEDLLYELFCNAGPIEEISFAKNGKSCFVVFEHADAVVTAKDIFKDVKLDGRPLRMFDHDEIAKIHSLQEEQIAQKKNYHYESNQSQNFNSNSYEGPHHLQGNLIYPSYNRNAPDYRINERYSELNRRKLPHNNITSSKQPEVENDHRDWRANSMRQTSMTCYSSNNDSQSRPDLLPSTSNQISRAQKFDPNSSIHDLMTSSSHLLDNLMNPYSMPVSRNPQDRFSNRSSQVDYNEYSADFPGNFMQRRSRNNQDEYDHNEVFDNSVDHGDTRRNQRNKYGSNHHSSYYRDHPYREHQRDRESYARGPKFTNSSSRTNYKSTNPHTEERDHKYRGHQKFKSRRH